MTDYEAIAKEHLLDYGRKVEKYGRILADMLYSDRTHFIYELLQNAEDAGATYVAFTLFTDHLEVRHNGRSFNKADVLAICSIGEGTKSDDMTKIGKFGIGFKSVYAHTTAPQIHSADEHFVIVDFVFPQACSAIELGESETLIIIPFNRSSSDTYNSYEHIAKRLPNLNSQTLLFLHSIREIQWHIKDQHSGHYLRDTRETEFPLVRWVDILDQQMNVENWLVFSSPIEYEDYGMRVEIAFAIEGNSKTGQLQIRKMNNAKLVVFFPTEKPTFFGFVMQGPYRTTPARDNITQDHPLNKTLIAGTAELILTIADILKTLNLLDANALNAWMMEVQPPSNWEFQPIYDAIVLAFRTCALLPTTSGDFIRGTSAKIARGQELLELFSQHQLQQVFPSIQDVAWLDGRITELGKFAKLFHFLREQIKVEELTPTKITELPTFPLFLTAQTNEWMTRFYVFLLSQRALWEYERTTFREIPFIRLESGEHVKPFKPNKEPNAYLPLEGRETAFPVVSREICLDSEAKKFLERLGLHKPDLTAEVLDFILPKYEDNHIDVATDEEYLHDLNAMAEALDQANEKQRKILKERISRAYVMRSQNALDSASMGYTSPNFSVAKNGEYDFLYFDNPKIWYIHNDVPTSVVNVFKSHDLARPHPVRARHPDWLNRVQVASTHGWHKRGLEGFDPDCEIDGLAHALQNISIDRASLIWNKLLLPYKHQISGIVEISTRQTFEGSSKEKLISPMGRLVREVAWLPDRNGQFHLASELMLDNLPDEFSRDEVLGAQLGMLPSTIKLLAEQSGIDVDDINWLRQLSPGVLRKLRSNHPVQSRDGANQQPSSDIISTSRVSAISKADEESTVLEPLIDYEDELSDTFNRPGHEALVNSLEELSLSGNPQRRIDKTKEQIAQAYREEQARSSPSASYDSDEQPQTQYQIIEHQLNPPLTHITIVSANVVIQRRWEGKDPQTRTFLLQQYGGACQICGQTFPRRSDGQAYFEGIYMVQRSKGRWIDRPGNVLCLCANHAAQFLHGSVVGQSFIDEVLSISYDALDYHFSINLCGKPEQVRFTQRHIIDLKALVEFGRSTLD